MLTFNSPVKQLPGVGEARAKLLFKLDITDTGSLLRHFPRAYQHRGNVRLLSEAADGEFAAFILTVRSQPVTKEVKNRMTVTKFSAADKSGAAVIVFFNQRYVGDIFGVGDTFRFWGKLTYDRGVPTLVSPAYEEVREGRPLPEFVPIYRLTSGLSQKYLGNLTRAALERIEPGSYPELLPKEAYEKLGLCRPAEAYRYIHFPQNYAELDRGRKYFVFEELYIFSLALTRARKERATGGAPPLGPVDPSEFLSALPFELTRAQKRVINEIYADMVSPARRPMARLVSGDVGSGKTICAAAAVYFAVKNGYQAMMMAPTEILAAQHYKDLSALFSRLGVSVALLTGSTKASEKKAIKEGLASGEIDFVIGTHALITDDVELKNPALVITDEQHRFGVMQRAKLASKGKNLHVLVMSATPIPRTLAMILYGDLDLSAIDELPPGRQKVDTYIVDESYRERLNAFISKNVKEGGQVYIVCPTIEEHEDDNELGEGLVIGEGGVVGFDFDGTREGDTKLKSAVKYAEVLQNEVFPNFRVGLIHGKMRPAEKDAVMSEFAAGNIDILVSTTVIEVGINVPNASLMIVENAERFGLAQLHQLRGRVGRGTRKSYCILVSDTKNEQSKRRLQVLRETSDGYKVAEADLELRGPGDFFPRGDDGSPRQHGELRFRFASLWSDMELLKSALELASTCEPPPAALETVRGLFDISY